ncbi:MAG: J domain-containing protein [Sphingomonadales bacterium]
MSRGTKTVASIAVARQRLQEEIDRIGGRHVTLSTNVELRLDGQPRSDRAQPADPGAALYFQRTGKPVVLACDRWDRVADNIIAIAKHIEAIRGMERWGVGTTDQLFAGFEALPAPEQWWQVLGVAPTASVDQIDAAWRDKARAAHPDQGGTDAAMARLNWAHDEGRRAVQP